MNFGRDDFVQTSYQDLSDPLFPKVISLVANREMYDGQMRLNVRIYLRYPSAAETHHHPELKQIDEQTFEVLPGSILFDSIQKEAITSPKTICFNAHLAKLNTTN